MAPQHDKRSLSAHLAPSGWPPPPQPRFPRDCRAGAAAVRSSLLIWTRTFAMRRDAPDTPAREAQSQRTSCAVRRAAAVPHPRFPRDCCAGAARGRNPTAHLEPSGGPPLFPQPRFPRDCRAGAAAVRSSWLIWTRTAAMRRDIPDTPAREAQSQRTSCGVRRASAVVTAAPARLRCGVNAVFGSAPSPCAGTPLTSQCVYRGRPHHGPSGENSSQSDQTARHFS